MGKVFTDLLSPQSALAFFAEAAERPYKFSDILGAVQLGAEELRRDGDDTRKVRVVLSDLVQDDAQAKFKTAAFMANRDAAQEYARRLAGAPAELPRRHGLPRAVEEHRAEVDAARAARGATGFLDGVLPRRRGGVGHQRHRRPRPARPPNEAG